MQRLMWKFLFGYVTITLEGLYLEIFLDEIRKKYRIRSVKRQQYCVMEITVGARYAGEVISAAEKRSIRCTKTCFDPAARISAALIKRWWILTAAALLTAAAVWISGYCLKIEFIGNEALSDFALGSLLEENGIGEGMRKREIDVLAIKNLLYREYHTLSFAEVRFRGTTLLVMIDEGGEIPGILPQDPCSVAAEKRGVILEMTVGEGMAAAEVGDVVSAGDVLIKGAYRKKEKDFLVHARGKVIAQVDYIGNAEISLADGLVRTGKTSEERFLELGRLKISLYGENPFELFEEESVTEYTIPGNMPAFLRITQTTYHECERGISEQTLKAAETQLREKAYFAALAQVPEDAEIIDFYSVITKHGGKLRAVATVTVKEDIGENIPAVSDITENTEETGEN